MTSNQVFENCQLEKSHWKINHIVTKINIPSSYLIILMLNCLENTLKLQFDSYSIFQKQGTPFSSCLADATRRLALPGVALACLALRCLARQEEPRPMLSAGSDIWLLAQVV